MMNHKWNWKNLLLLGTGLLLASDLSAQDPAQNAPAVSVVAEKAQKITETGTRKYIGSLEAIEEVTLVARVSGYLNKINFREGELVKAGQPLFEIEDTTYQAQVKTAEAKLRQIEAELIYAENKIVSEEAFEDATRLLNFRKACLAEAEATLIDAKNNLSYTKILSPITGKIGKSTYTRGNYVTPTSKVLADIVQIAPIYVRFSISENDYLSLFGNAENIKEKAVVRIQTADKKLYGEKGKVTLVDNKVDSETGTMMIWATFENKDMKLNPGGLVTVLLSKAIKEEKTAVKLSAVQAEASGNFVYVIDAQNHALKRPVKLGEIVGNMQIIEEGVAPGETVAVDGTHKILQPGMPVTPVFED